MAKSAFFVWYYNEGELVRTIGGSGVLVVVCFNYGSSH